MNILLENLRPGRTGHLRLLPNINVSGRALPETTSSADLSENSRLDREKPSRKLSDREIHSLIVSLSPAELSASAQLVLEVSYDPSLFLLLSSSGIKLAGQEKSPFLIDLKAAASAQTKSRGIQFFIEAQTFWGSPMVAKDASPTMSFRILDGAGVVLLDKPRFGGADIRTADVILLGDDAPADRIFACDVGENGPSIIEITAAAKTAGVPLTIVPIEIGNGDSWMQDQFQIGYTGTTQTAQQVILHLPRVATDSAIFPGAPNLRNFVDTHFPSNAISVVKDFWRQTFDISDGVTTPLTMEVANSYVVYKQLSLVPRILSQLLNLLFEIDGKARPSIPDGGDLYAVRLAIDRVLAQLRSYTAVTADQQAKVKGASFAVESLSGTLATSGSEVRLMVEAKRDDKTEKLTFIYGADNAALLRDLFDALYDVHSSRNYGGNIEVSPPTSDAPFGKILAGSISSRALTDFLTSRRSLHPLVKTYTDWLEVGHIDEIAAFAPAPGGFCVLRASPKLAIDMLQRLLALQAGGTAVTRLLRGKKWMHLVAKGATDPIAPPAAHIRWVGMGGYDLSGLARRFPKDGKHDFGDAAYHDDRRFLVLNRRSQVDARYAAMISCADLLSVCRASSQAVEDLFLADGFAYADNLAYQRYYDSDQFKKSVFPYRLDKVLSAAFPGARVYGLPVLFDHTNNFLSGHVSALTPAAVNFQTLGKVALVPRPYGPRMGVADAAAFMNDLFARLRYPGARVDEMFIRSRGLDKTWHWTRAEERVTRADLANMPTDFDADYEEMKKSRAWAMANAARDFMNSAALDMIAPVPFIDLYAMQHENDPLSNHPVSEPETLERVAGYFKDGFDAFKNVPVDFCNGDTEDDHPKFDQYQTDIKDVMDRIARANPGVFDAKGAISSKDWVRIEIPEDKVDIFELYTQVLMEAQSLKVCWVDSWYYHTHKGGVHCGTNVLRRFVAPSG